MKSNFVKIADRVFLVIILLGIIFAVSSYITFTDYMSVKFYRIKSEESKNAVCSEYFINPRFARIECTYEQGGRGRVCHSVRLRVTENDIKTDFADLMNISVECGDWHDVNKNSPRMTQDGIEIDSWLDIQILTDEKLKDDFSSLWVFSSNGSYYMEMEKRSIHTDGLYPGEPYYIIKP